MTRTFAAGLLAAALVVCAAPAEQMKANVPFAFQVGETVMPAGQYQVTATATNLVFLRADSGNTVTAIASPGRRSRVKDTPGLLVFNRYGDSYFLSTIWKVGSEGGHVLRTSHREKEMLASAHGVETAQVALKHK